MKDLVLAIEPTASATRLALFRGESPVAAHTARQQTPEPGGRERGAHDIAWRARAGRSFLGEAGVAAGELAAVATTGGVLKPIEGGTYLVEEKILRDCERSDRGHPSVSIGALVAKAIADDHRCPAYVVDPLSVDELEPVARLGGTRADHDEPRTFTSILGMRAVARHHARAVERPLEELKLIVARLGTDACLCAHRDGRVVDAVSAAADDLIARAGMRDVREAEERAEAGDRRSMVLLDGMAYGLAKSIGALAAALGGEIDAVLLTGNAADATALVNGVCRRVEWIAPVFVYPGDDDLLALAQGAWRVLTGEERAKSYR